MDNILLSIGEACGPAAQIRRYTQSKDAFFYDWLITPLRGLEFILESNDNFLASDNWEIVDFQPPDSDGAKGGVRVMDRFTEIRFQHEFAVKSDEIGVWGHPIDASKVEEHLPVAKSKFVYLKDKFLHLISESPNIVLIRCENHVSNIEYAEYRINQIRDIFSKINPSIKYGFISDSLSNGSSGLDYLVFNSKKSDHWSGDDESYDTFLGMCKDL
jgi:hypothetical protein